MRDVVAERAGERQRPGHRPLPAVALLDGGVGRREHTARRTTRHRRGPIVTIAVPLRTPHDVPVDVDLDEGGQGEQQVGRGGTGVGEQRGAVDAGAQRQPDLGRRTRPAAASADGQTSRRTGGASRRASSAAGPGSSATASAVRSAENATAPDVLTTRGAAETRQHRREADAEATDRARVVPLGRRAQRRERRHPRRGQRRAGVRDPQLGRGPAATAPPRLPRHRAARLPRIGARRPAPPVPGPPPECAPALRRSALPQRRPVLGLLRCRRPAASRPAPAPQRRTAAGRVPTAASRDERDPQPSRNPRGVGGVLGQLDEPACRRNRRGAGPLRRWRPPGTGWATPPRRRGRPRAAPRCRRGRPPTP